MMKLDINTHKTILFQIMQDVANSTLIAPHLGFKGGTAAMFFYGLDRFSVDLDFDLLEENMEEKVFEEINHIAKKYGKVRDTRIKRYNLFWLISYEENARQIKIEINKRKSISSYEIKTTLGVSMLVMRKDDMVANKMLAMYDRMEKTSRDIYDTWFFLHHRFPVNTDIIESRSNISTDEFVKKLIHRLENLKDNRILTGIGELITPQQKDWAREKLKQETVALLSLRFLK